MTAIHRFTGRFSSRPAWITGALIGTALLTLAVAQLAILSAAAEAPATDAFQRTWARTDQPVADGSVLRTWMWGPAANTGALEEPYDEAPGGMRTVQYYDKSRMEDASWTGATDPWDVTNGLLVVEMVTGQLQLGNTHFEAHTPATANIAGDPGSQPTYADIAAFGLREQPATAVGTTLTTWVDGSGILTTAPASPPASVTAAERLTVEGIDHTVASVFWDFMNSSGPVEENGTLINAKLFLNPYYATGYPITEAYWSAVTIGGTPTTVLWQCFERRCLTYNPANEAGWQVEAGNVGQHYYDWRSSLTPSEPTPTSTTGPGEPTSTTAPGQPTNTAVSATNTTVPATNTTVPATNTTVPATSTTAPATSTTAPTGYLNVKVVDKDGNSNLPAGVVITSNTLKAYTKVSGDSAGASCGGSLVTTFSLNLSTLTASKSVAAGDYCVELSARGYIVILGTQYNGSLFSSGIGTVNTGAPMGSTNVTIKVTIDNVVPD